MIFDEAIEDAAYYAEALYDKRSPTREADKAFWLELKAMLVKADELLGDRSEIYEGAIISDAPRPGSKHAWDKDDHAGMVVVDNQYSLQGYYQTRIQAKRAIDKANKKTGGFTV